MFPKVSDQWSRISNVLDRLRTRTLELEYAYLGVGNTARLELGLIAILLLSHAMVFQTLFSGSTTIRHDNLVWNYPVFVHYFRELAEGQLVTFNFYSRFGEPFAPYVAQMRLFDPALSLLGVTLWKMSSTPLQAFNWFHYLVGLVHCLGIYILLRSYTRFLWVRGILLFSLGLGSVMLSPFQQDGFLNQFLWIPFIAIILRSLIQKDESPRAWKCLLLGLLIGSSFQSYFFAFNIMFSLGFLGLHFAFYGCPKVFLRRNHPWRSVGLIFFPLVMMSVLNIYTFVKSRDWIYPARTPPVEQMRVHGFTKHRIENVENRDRFSVSQKLQASTGASSQMWDYIQMFSPAGNMQLQDPSTRPVEYTYGRPSEAFLYFGIIPLLIGIFGFTQVRNASDKIWINLLAFYFLLGLGHELGVYTWFSQAYIPLQLVRNPHCLVLFTSMAFLYFVVRGGEELGKRLMVVR
ncbi:MAG: hypothetical protein AB7F86_10510 [Bdellovibrionales bacterium]